MRDNELYGGASCTGDSRIGSGPVQATPQTVENVIDQEIAHLLGRLHRLATVKVNTPPAILRHSASGIRELAQLL